MIDRKETVVGISKIENRAFLNLNSEHVEVCDYKILSSADGTTELSVKIVGLTNVFELSASLVEKQLLNQ